MIIEDILYPEEDLKELCKKHNCFYIDNRFSLSYKRESNPTDYDASFVIVKTQKY
jgi:hypothetical protein